jgi:hypothetical protein
MLVSRLRKRGLAGTASFAVRLAGVALSHPREALDHLSTQLALGLPAPPPAPAPADSEWRPKLHEALGEPWPCSEHEEFHELWSELMAELSVDVPVGTGHDADPTLSEAAWCIVRHQQPAVVVETGVSRGITSRVILEALARNGSGRLWSVDLPPLEEPWRRLAGSAVPATLRGGWTYLRGSSRRRLPPLVRELGLIDLFLHDSLHVEENLRFELGAVWPVLRPGGFALIDDAQACRAFDGIVSELAAAPALAAPHSEKDDVVGILRKAARGETR